MSTTNSRLRVLLVEDSEDDALLLVHHLQMGGYGTEWERVDTEPALFRALNGKPWDVIVCDFSMPQLPGYEALRIVREHDHDTPFIFLSDIRGEEVAVEAIRSGAQDYVMKENLSRLPPAVERGVREAGVRRRSRETEDDLRRNGQLRRRFIDVGPGALAQVRAYVTGKEMREDNLRQSQRREDLGTLMGGLAHDFNNILGIILGYASLLRQFPPDSERFARALDAITRAVDRGTGLTRQILALSRKSEPVFSAIDMNRMVGDFVTTLRETLPDTIGYEVNLCPGNPVISGDAAQLHRVLLNLCLNARDAMPSGGTIGFATEEVLWETVRAKFAAARESPYLQLTVSDTGIGMDDMTRRRAFEPFFTTKEKGTGLGLPSVMGIVKGHGGFVDLESRLGGGTAFSIFFPLLGLPANLPVTEPAVASETRMGQESILVIEDETLLLEMLRSFLEGKGYHVIGARDGLEGVETFREHQDEIALVLCDMGLPKLAGEEVFVRLRDIRPEVRVLLVSGYLDPESERELSAGGVCGFVPKPYDPDELLMRIREVLDGEFVRGG